MSAEFSESEDSTESDPGTSDTDDDFHEFEAFAEEPRDVIPEGLDNSGGCVWQPQWCETCGQWQPLRTYHCRVSGRCVAKFDHYCSTIGTVIGERNHARFWWFLLFETATLDGILAAAPAIVYGGLFGVAVGFTLQVVAQQHAIASHAAIILSLEAVFAAIAGALLLGEMLAPRGYLGCALMFGGMLLAQLWPKPLPAALSDSPAGADATRR